jgi:hypothetical protein
MNPMQHLRRRRECFILIRRLKHHQCSTARITAIFPTGLLRPAQPICGSAAD